MIDNFIFFACVAALFFLAIIVLQLAGIRKNTEILGQIVAIGIQRAGLVRTPEELATDTEAADEETSEAELEAEEALRDQENDITM